MDADEEVRVSMVYLLQSYHNLFVTTRQSKGGILWVQVSKVMVLPSLTTFYIVSRTLYAFTIV